MNSFASSHNDASFNLNVTPNYDDQTECLSKVNGTELGGR